MASAEDLIPQLAAAIAPSAADIARATEAVLEELSQGARPTGGLIGAAAAALGAPTGGTDNIYNAGDGSSKTIDADAPVLVTHRAGAAGRLALAKLVAAGQIVPAVYPGAVRIDVVIGNSMYRSQGPVRVPADEVTLTGEAYRLAPGVDPATALPLSSVEPWLAQAGPLLTRRTERTLAEALAAARRGLYQAALTLLGAVSEGAWYVVGESFRDRSHDLADNLDREATAQVQRLVRDELAKVKRQRSAAGELYAHASYLRDIRNYGIHAGGVEDESLEHAFSESASAIIVLETQRHLVRLLAAAHAAGAEFAVEPS